MTFEMNERDVEKWLGRVLTAASKNADRWQRGTLHRILHAYGCAVSEVYGRNGLGKLMDAVEGKDPAVASKCALAWKGVSGWQP